MIKFKFIQLIIYLVLICVAQSAIANSLYPGEKLLTINGFQTLVKFIKGDPNKQLVIFVPGNSHLARISYGYPTGNKKDFLSYWINKKGYSFLGASYPLGNTIYSQIYPAFSIRDWGNQIAETAKQIIQKNKLSNHVIVLGWSMGGSIEETVSAAAKQRGLIIDVFIGLSAVPPLPYIMPPPLFKIDKMLVNGLADRNSLYPWFVKALDEQNDYNHHIIIPRNIYLTEFLGNIPIALGAEGYHYQSGKFVYDIQETLKNSGIFNFANTPWIGLVRDDSPSLMNISYIDPACWNFLRMQMIYHNYFLEKNLIKISPGAWKIIQKTIDYLFNDLVYTVHGNHFFFVGEKGAKETASKIDMLVAKLNQLKNMLDEQSSL